MATWKELRRQGVERCQVVFANGDRCRRRSLDQAEFAGPCDLHTTAKATWAAAGKEAEKGKALPGSNIPFPGEEL